MPKITLRDLGISKKTAVKLNKIDINTPQDLYDKRHIRFEESGYFNRMQSASVKKAIKQIDVLGLCEKNNGKEEKKLSTGQKADDGRPQIYTIGKQGSAGLKDVPANPETKNSGKHNVEGPKAAAGQTKRDGFAHAETDNKQEDNTEDKKEQGGACADGLNDVEGSKEEEAVWWPEISKEDNIHVISAIMDESDDMVHIYPSQGLSKKISTQAKKLGVSYEELVHGLGFILVWADKRRSSLSEEDKAFRSMLIKLAGKNNDREGSITLQPDADCYKTVLNRAKTFGMGVDEYCGMLGFKREAVKNNRDPLRTDREASIRVCNKRIKKTDAEERADLSMPKEGMKEDTEQVVKNDTLHDPGLAKRYVESRTISTESTETFRELQKGMIIFADKNNTVDLNAPQSKVLKSAVCSFAKNEKMSVASVLALFGCREKQTQRREDSLIPEGKEREFEELRAEMEQFIQGWILPNGEIRIYYDSVIYNTLYQKTARIGMTPLDFIKEIQTLKMC